MEKQFLNIKYKCTHPSCQVFCIKGEIMIEEEYFKELSESVAEKDLFKSPPGACRMGIPQPFRAISVEKVTEESLNAKRAEQEAQIKKDPLKMLVDEHKEVLKKLDVIEDQVRMRDVDGLWVSTAAVENDIILHSIKKEEEVLFPIVRDRIQMGEGLIAIMNEDHREFISLLHGFRFSLQEGEIHDGIIRSILVNLRNHIRKEDEEFFRFCNDNLEVSEKEELYERMIKLESEHVALNPGDRKSKPLAPLSSDGKALDEQIRSIKSSSSVGGIAMGCCSGH